CRRRPAGQEDRPGILSLFGRWTVDGGLPPSTVYRPPSEQRSVMQASDLIQVAPEPPIALVTLNHPPANAINGEVIAGLKEALERLDKDQGIRAVVLTGAGRMFVAGADVTAFRGASALKIEELAREGNDLFNWIERSDMVFVAAINGPCLGGGQELAL